MTHPSGIFSPHHGKAPGTGFLPTLLVLLLLFASALPAFCAAAPKRLILFAPEARVHNNTVIVDLGVSIDSIEGLANLLRDGAVLSLDITLNIERERSWWANAEAGSKEYASVLRHDPLSRDFIVTIPNGAGFRETRDRNLPRLLKASWLKLELPLVRVEMLADAEPAEEYLIVAGVSLHHTEVPPWIENTTLFWSSEVVPAEKRTAVFSLAAQQDAP